mgnify:CR=1 FL=1
MPPESLADTSMPEVETWVAMANKTTLSCTNQYVVVKQPNRKSFTPQIIVIFEIANWLY